jgi:hypothetical protein
MIDTVVNAIMILGIVVASVPTLTFAVTGLVHLAYSAYKLVK